MAKKPRPKATSSVRVGSAKGKGRSAYRPRGGGPTSQTGSGDYGRAYAMGEMGVEPAALAATDYGGGVTGSFGEGSSDEEKNLRAEFARLKELYKKGEGYDPGDDFYAWSQALHKQDLATWTSSSKGQGAASQYTQQQTAQNIYQNFLNTGLTATQMAQMGITPTSYPGMGTYTPPTSSLPTPTPTAQPPRPTSPTSPPAVAPIPPATPSVPPVPTTTSGLPPVPKIVPTPSPAVTPESILNQVLTPAPVATSPTPIADRDRYGRG